MIQLGLLLYLTGGLQNPFAILMLAPVTVAATILSLRSVIGLSTLTVLAISLLAIFHLPLPWYEPAPEPSLLYVLGVWTALVLSTLFVAFYVWSVAEEARRMRDAFAATQLALAREQRVSAVGGLAAAAAHQLGSPLATIAVIAKELVRDLPKTSPHAEDAALAAQPKRALPHHPCRPGAAPRKRRRTAATHAVLRPGRGRRRTLSRGRDAARRHRDPDQRGGARRQRRRRCPNRW